MLTVDLYAQIRLAHRDNATIVGAALVRSRRHNSACGAGAQVLARRWLAPCPHGVTLCRRCDRPVHGLSIVEAIAHEMRAFRAFRDCRRRGQDPRPTAKAGLGPGSWSGLARLLQA